MRLDEIEALIKPPNFSPFVIVTKGGLRMEIPHSEFMTIPPDSVNGELPSYVIAYTTGKVTVPVLIELNAIDHIDYEPSLK